MTLRHLAPLLALWALLGARPLRAEDPAPTTLRAPTAWLVLSSVDPRGRQPFAPDLVAGRRLLPRDAAPPTAGAVERGAGGVEARWTEAGLDEQGRLAAPEAAWAWSGLEVADDDAGVWLLEARGAGLVQVDGVPHAGDVYGQGHLRTPVALRAGTVPLLVRGLRGAPRLTFTRPPAPLFVDAYDAVVPAATQVFEGDAVLGLVVTNATTAWSERAELLAEVPADEGPAPVRGRASVPPIPPLGQVQVPVELDAAFDAPVPSTPLRLDVVLRRGASVLSSLTLPLAEEPAEGPWTITFLSGIDGSAQRYAVRPPAGETAPVPGRALVLTLHGAGVDARGQAAAYAPQPGRWVVAPTNRRPFGFDWQDWGRRDAYEVLDHALAWTGADPRRVHLTGHSMGGHGTWHLAANDADRWASAAPSAGWISFDTYGGRPTGPLTGLWHAADASSLTLELLDQLAQLPIFVLHGTADDNVPVTEAERMIALLKDRDPAFTYHLQEGAGHWWDGDPAPGAACVDGPGFHALWDTAVRPDAPDDLVFVTVDPGVDAEHFWLRIEQARAAGAPLRVEAHRRHGPGGWRVEATTTNVHRLVVRADVRAAPAALTLDGQEVPVPAVAWVRGPSGWAAADAPCPAGEKRPERTGPFKRAFDRRFVMVVGTAGDDTEDQALVERARFDAEAWRMRANGRAEVVTDQDFLAHADEHRGRNVILYGNADTNAAWDAVLPAGCPIRLRRGAATLGTRTLPGEDLGALFVVPRRDDDDALVGVIGDTGRRGTRLGTGLPLFLSGVGWPDYVVFGPEVLTQGDAGVRHAGFFDRTWSLAD